MSGKAEVLDAAVGRWRDILGRFGIGGDFLTGKHTPCPMCGGKDRFRFTDQKGQGRWICNKCGTGAGVHLLMRMNGWDFRTAAHEVEKIVGDCRPAAPKRERTEPELREAMNALWRRGHPITPDDPGGKWLRRRVGLVGNYPASLRTVDRLNYRGGGAWPAMIAKLTAPDGKPAQIHRTYLTAEGEKAPEPDPRRMMPGSIPKGSAVRLAPAAEWMGVAEGIETALAASIIFKMPVWAALNANMLRDWEPPPEAKHVIVMADNDMNFVGQLAAYTLAARLGSACVGVYVTDVPGTDWNDQLSASDAYPSRARPTQFAHSESTPLVPS